MSQPPFPPAASETEEEDPPTVSLRPQVTHGPPPPLQGGGTRTGTDPVAVLSVVFAVLFSPLGVVLGIVGRRRTRRTGRPGRGLATIGLTLSVVFLAAGVAAALYLTVLATPTSTPAPVAAPDQPGVSASAAPTDAVPTGTVPTGPAGTATVGVADGDYGPEVPADALAEQVGAQSGATDVICPGYLPAQVDASTVCAGTVDGQQAQLQTQVTAVEGAEATIDITRVG